VYISEVSSWRDAGLCVGDFHNAKEYIVFRIMVQCSPVLGGRLSTLCLFKIPLPLFLVNLL
jgi:hypothetical protein